MERATEHAEATLRTHNPEPGWHLVTADSHPEIFNIFEIISHDNGFGAGHTNYSVPDIYTPDQLSDFDMLLTIMGREKAEEFAIGGEDDRVVTGELQALDQFLNDFFNDWDDSYNGEAE